MREKAGTAVDEIAQSDNPRPERRIGPKGILGLLCAISLLVFADRGTTLVLQLSHMPYQTPATCHALLLGLNYIIVALSCEQPAGIISSNGVIGSRATDVTPAHGIQASSGCYAHLAPQPQLAESRNCCRILLHCVQGDYNLSTAQLGLISSVFMVSDCMLMHTT